MKGGYGMAVKETKLVEGYHEMFGQPLHGDNALFERLTIQVFQAGLNWKMVVNKLPILQQAFANFAIEKVVQFDENEVQQIMMLPGMIHNVKKIRGTIQNAHAIQQLSQQDEGFEQFLSHYRQHTPLSHEAQLQIGTEVAKKLHQRGFTFTGPETTRVFLASIGTWPLMR